MLRRHERIRRPVFIPRTLAAEKVTFFTIPRLTCSAHEKWPASQRAESQAGPTTAKSESLLESAALTVDHDYNYDQ